MSLNEKLLRIQTEVDGIVKDGLNQSDKYDFASSNIVLNRIRPLMNELHLLLIPNVCNARLSEGVTRSGTTRYMTEIWYNMEWIDVDSGETKIVPWYAQGVDLAGEKGVGKAATYAEKYFLLKAFHIPTDRDDPDRDERSKTGEKKQRGTQAAKENADYMRQTIVDIADIIADGDKEKLPVIIKAFTEAPSRGYAGVESVDAISDKALAPAYAKAKAHYKKRFNKEYGA
jgi:hypothetical protein